MTKRGELYTKGKEEQYSVEHMGWIHSYAATSSRYRMMNHGLPGEGAGN